MIHDHEDERAKWTVVAYKSSSEDYCRGCHMASYDSDFELVPCYTMEELRETLLRFELANHELLVNEAGWEVTIIRGAEVDDFEPLEEVSLLPPGLEYQVAEEANRIRAERLQKEKEALAQAQAAKKKKDAEEREARERTELARLQAKYPSAEGTAS